MEREEINNMEENLENLETIEKEYQKVSMYLNLSKIGFALCAAAMALVSFSPIPLLIKVPLIFISSIILINDDCKRVDYLNRRIELRKLKNSYVDTEEMDNVTENKKQNKLGLGKKLKKLLSKDKEEILPLPVDEDTIEVEDLDNEELSEEINPVKKQGLFSRLFNKNKVEKKEKTNTSCKLVETLTIDTDGDFSKISGISDSFLDNGVTKENADYVYNMKIGQKLKFETNEKIAGYESVGSGVELSENNTELVATKNGTIKGYITFGSTKKSFYIIVEENTNNEQLEDIIIKIDSEESKTEDTKIPTTETTSKTETVKNNSDSTTAKTELPKTGINTIIYITMAIVGIAVVSFIILNKKYKDIK